MLTPLSSLDSKLITEGQPSATKVFAALHASHIRIFNRKLMESSLSSKESIRNSVFMAVFGLVRRHFAQFLGHQRHPPFGFNYVLQRLVVELIVERDIIVRLTLYVVRLSVQFDTDSFAVITCI